MNFPHVSVKHWFLIHGSVSRWDSFSQAADQIQVSSNFWHLVTSISNFLGLVIVQGFSDTSLWIYKIMPISCGSRQYYSFVMGSVLRLHVTLVISRKGLEWKPAQEFPLVLVEVTFAKVMLSAFQVLWHVISLQDNDITRTWPWAVGRWRRSGENKFLGESAMVTKLAGRLVRTCTCQVPVPASMLSHPTCFFLLEDSVSLRWQ